VTPTTREGFLYGLGAYVWWGLVPLYFLWLGKFNAYDFVAHRIVWSAVLLAVVITLTKRWPDTLHGFRTPSLLLPLTVSAVLVAYNWLMYVLCVVIGEIVQASLGYYILPLVSVVLGLVIFRERLRPMQYAAIAFAATGVVLLTREAAEFPSLGLALALSFSVYGMIRKKVPVDGLVGLTVETFVLAPIALGYLMYVYCDRSETENMATMFKLSVSGVVTAIPLLCFGQAARRLPLAMLGFMQYISPSLQFFLALWLFKENISGQWMYYALVWIALVVFSVDSFLWYRRYQQAPV
jgi:chloramphenicol-sensitive protein RarD